MENRQATNILDMQTYFEERMANLKQISRKTLHRTQEEFHQFKAFILQSLKAFSQQLESFAREVDNLEMRSRRKILLIHDEEERRSEETVHVVTDIVRQHLKNYNFTSNDVRRCHRMGRQASSDKPRPILVKFQTVAVRDSTWFAKTKLKGSGVTLSEFLTRSRHAAFMAAREKFGVNECWTREGCIYILGPDGNRHRIASIGDLNKIRHADIEKPPIKPAPVKAKRGTAAPKK